MIRSPWEWKAWFSQLALRPIQYWYHKIKKTPYINSYQPIAKVETFAVWFPLLVHAESCTRGRRSVLEIGAVQWLNIQHMCTHVTITELFNFHSIFNPITQLFIKTEARIVYLCRLRHFGQYDGWVSIHHTGGQLRRVQNRTQPNFWEFPYAW